MSTKPRYYRREHSGYMSGYGRSPMTTEVMVIDRDYCHRVVESLMPVRKSDGRFANTHSEDDLYARRVEADRLVAMLNRGDEA